MQQRRLSRQIWYVFAPPPPASSRPPLLLFHRLKDVCLIFPQQTEEMQNQAVEVATEAMDKYSIEKDIAQYIKKEFDSKYGATWHCIVGRNFGSFVTHGRFQRPSRAQGDRSSLIDG